MNARHPRRVIALTALVACAACSDETVGPTAPEFEALCGQSEPLHLLPLGTDELPSSVEVRAFGDRYLVSLLRDRGDESPVTGGRNAELHAVGQCGAEPVLLAEEIDAQLLEFAPYPELLWGCRDADRALLALDPTGARAPSPAFATLGCEVRPTSAGLVAIIDPDADEIGTLVLQPWPEDPFAGMAEQILLLDGVKLEAGPEPHVWSGLSDVFDATDDEAFAVTVGDELVAVSLSELTPEVLATGVREFALGTDGRRVAWQDVEILGDSSTAAGALTLLDREAGVSSALGEGVLDLGPDPFLLEPLGVLSFLDADAGAHYLRLPDLETLSLTASLVPLRIVDDERVLFSQASRPAYTLVDLGTGEAEVIYEGSARHTRLEDSGILVLEAEGGALRFISNTGESKLLASSVELGYELASDQRVVTSFAVGDDEVGQLVIVDPETLEDQLIAEDVFQFSPSLHEPTAGELIVSYLVADEDPERSGLWIAKPAKPE